MKIQSISLITSVECNLKCEYCLINQNKSRNKEYAHSLQSNIIKALSDGSFYLNAQKSIVELGAFPNDINFISLWGQEQTIILPYITKNIDMLFNCFPNVKTLFFSTNGITGDKDIIDFIKKLDSILTRPLIFQLQWSYDGNYSSVNLRHDSEIQSLQTFKNVIKELNSIKLYNLNIEFMFHGVISQDLIQHLNGDMDSIKNFWESNLKITHDIKDLILNEKVFMSPTFGCAPEVPFKSTTEEGISFFDFYLKTTMVLNEPFLKITNFCTGWTELLNKNEDFYNKIDSLDEVIEYYGNTISNYFDRSIHSKNLSNFLFCGVGYNDLKIMYDGSLVNCQNLAYEQKIEDISKNQNEIEYDMKIAWAKHGYSLNPIFASEQEKEKYKYIFEMTKTKSFYFTWNTTFSKMFYMAKCNQISPSYKNNIVLLIKHSFLLTFISHCMYNNGIYTGSIFSKDTGLIRRYCNGFLEQQEIEINKQLLNKDNNGLIKGLGGLHK